MAKARAGDAAGALALAEAALHARPDDAGLSLFAGMMHARELRLDEAAPHLRRAVALAPGDPLPRLELARLLIALDQGDEADAVIASIARTGPAALEADRLAALSLRRRGRPAEAAALYEAVVAADPADFMSWEQLGLCRKALGQDLRAIDALARSVRLRPDRVSARTALAEQQAAAGQGEAALALARESVRRAPADPWPRWTLARLQDLTGSPAEAIATLEEAQAVAPDCVPVLASLADLLERANRIEAVAPLLDRMERIGGPPAETALLRARLLLRQGELETALACAKAAPASRDRGTRASLIGQIADRLGRSDEAFAAFRAMNGIDAADYPGAFEDAADFRAEIARTLAATTAEGVAGWAAAPPPHPRGSPVFLIGFLRSGTTLLDNFLAGRPDVAVLEEQPALQRASEAARIGGIGDLARLDPAAIDRTRARYFDAVDALAPGAPGRLVVDKQPLGVLSIPLIHRLFPDARFLFVERHPLDVVLSCYMTRFGRSRGMGNFLRIEDIARLYDLVLATWVRCRAIFPLAVQVVRYERLVADPRAELAPVAGFLGLDWQEGWLDHQRTARSRAPIGTPSYAPVAEPIYARASGRWRRYRAELRAAEPLVARWAHRMGYAIDDGAA